ncbi:hypothetical protein EYF80_058614 [Liparis tanakae]|uniref:Uncharacterized protein n=1 Tax=Liparis tanakae TaxID=230148 RepID=A0A4Z2ESA0_9TELE|nr:hypothetical protein EYF80_058614 [Liparis tanakae]
MRRTGVHESLCGDPSTDTTRHHPTPPDTTRHHPTPPDTAHAFLSQGLTGGTEYLCLREERQGKTLGRHKLSR